jgi:hypothetical protein
MGRDILGAATVEREEYSPNKYNIWSCNGGMLIVVQSYKCKYSISLSILSCPTILAHKGALIQTPSDSLEDN